MSTTNESTVKALLSDARKSRPMDMSMPPHAIFKAPGYECRVFKANQKNHTKAYASWFCGVDLGIFGPVGENFGYGDTYVADVIGELVEVDGREPTDQEIREWAEIQAWHRANPAQGW